MRIITPLFCMMLLALGQIFAEGTREVAPNGSIDIMGNATTDVAALHINNPSYNSFAAYDNPDPLSRLYINIQDPATECIYLGFNWAHDNITSPNPPRINFEYRIKDPNGNVVFGPVTVTPADANITTWAEGHAGPMQIYGVGGYDAVNVTSSDLTSQGWSGKGDYYIEFRDDANNDLLIDFWDISVADCTQPIPTEKKGRIWSYNWSIFAINDFGFPNRPFNGAFFVCAPDPDNVNASFVTKIDFNGAGFQPAAFNVAFNSFGIQNTGDVAVDRRSVENTNGTIAEYSIFLNDPVDICVTAESGEFEILGVGRCNAEEYCIKILATKAGQVDLLLDFDGADNVYTPGTADVLITKTISAAEVGIPTCVEWNGLDGLGNPLPEIVGTPIPVVLAFAQGIYHFPIYDAEYMINGFMIEAVRPAAAVSLVFYDDSNISVASGSGEPTMQLSGCMPPCHRWTNYSMPNTPGFGNLNTINSWWFSQLIIRDDIFLLPNYFTCEITGPTSFCTGGTAELEYIPTVYPEGSDAIEMLTRTWSGPGIVGDNSGISITIDDGGIYELEVAWVNGVGDTCSTHCSYEVFLDPPGESYFDTILIKGESVVINGEIFSEGGEYMQLLTTSEGCDSILNISIIVLNTVIYYDLNECESFMGNGSHMDYSEFYPSYPDPLSCATIFADTLHRENPQVNKHSCTPGIDDSAGMCVGVVDTCDYIPGHESSVIIEITITPDPDTAVQLTSFSFYEKAPMVFEWISGNSGLNNYPTLFRVRVLKNGSEIFLTPPTPTSQTWNENVLDFFGNNDFLVKDPTTFRFELLAYCRVGNAGVESVWDLDEVRIMASCASIEGLNQQIAGRVTTPSGKPVSGVDMQLYKDYTYLSHLSRPTMSQGEFLFESVVTNQDYFLQGYKNDDPLNGVNTLDLILLQKHLLGIESLTTPYQMIAADADNNQRLSVIDLLQFRKLILGIDSKLPGNLSWRFGPQTQHLTMSNPWAFSEALGIEYFQEDILNAHFTGIKIGDLNDDVQPGFKSAELTPRSAGQFKLVVDNKKLKAGEVTRIDITSNQLHDIVGLQFCLNMINGQILDIEPGALAITSDYFNLTDGHQLKLSWNEAEELTVHAGEVLFSLIVLADSDVRVDQAIGLNEHSILQAEAYLGSSPDVAQVSFDYNSSAISAYQNQLMPNRPNPFSDRTSIQFDLEVGGPVQLTFYDVSGRQLHQIAANYATGSHIVEVSKKDLGMTSGLVICRLENNGFIATRKMMIAQ